MAELDTIRKELETLLKEVRQLQSQAAGPDAEKATAAAEPASAEAEASSASDALDELQAYLAARTGEAEEIFAEHPLATLAAAFLLGLVAGRIAFR